MRLNPGHDKKEFMIKIIAKPLSADLFNDYGQVLDNTTSSPRLNNAAHLENLRDGAKSNLLLALCQPATFPLSIAALERHPDSTQTFFPLDVQQYIIIVCPDLNKNTPDLQKIEAFVASGKQGINYLPGVWHHPMTTLKTAGQFAALMWEDGSKKDTEWYKIPKKSRPIVNIKTI